MKLKVKVEKKEKGIFVVSPLGSIDTTTYTELENTLNPLLTSSTKGLILNMEGVEYISSMGISVILKAKKAIETEGGSFIMTDLKPQIKLAFEIIQALPGLRIFESLQEADEYLIAMQKKEIEKQKEK